MEKFIKSYEVRVIIENVYMLGGCRGDKDKEYLEKQIARLIELMNQNQNNDN